MPEFIPGLELGELFYREAVRPILGRHFPGLAYDAALVGSGSEVLGLDTAMSMDHSWLPYVKLFVGADDKARYGKAIRDALAVQLPHTFRGFSTNWATHADDPGTEMQHYIDSGPVRHRVSVTYLPDWVAAYTGWDMSAGAGLLDWLTIPEQRLLALTAGRVYHDGLGQVTEMQQKLAYYPRDVWLYLLHAQWQRIGQEEPFVGRSGIAGDETGSAVIAARLVRDLMRLCFLVERRYAPYAKHLGAAFAQLACAPVLTPVLQEALDAPVWQEREQHLSRAYGYVAELFNDLGVTDPVVTEVTPFHSRPFMVIRGETIGRAAWDAIQDPAVKALPYGVGKVDQYVDSTDILTHPQRFRALSAIYLSENMT